MKEDDHREEGKPRGEVHDGEEEDKEENEQSADVEPVSWIVIFLEVCD